MAAIGAIPHDALSGFTVLGELGLDGSIAPVAGACCRPPSGPMLAATA
jgi:magnesium chelatase family protein